MNVKEAIKRAAVIFMIFIEITSINISEKTDFEKDRARAVLEEAYRPLEEFVRELSFSEYEGLLNVPTGIKCEDDFVELFEGHMDDSNARGFYEDLFVEKNGKRYVDAKEYIPSIYTEGSSVKKAYIREKQTIMNRLLKRDGKKTEELVVKVEMQTSGPTNSRTEYFTRDDSGKWILDHANGLSLCGLVHVSDNPWSEKWKDEP